MSVWCAFGSATGGKHVSAISHSSIYLIENHTSGDRDRSLKESAPSRLRNRIFYVSDLNQDASRTFIGIYQHSLRLYILEATAPAGSPPPGLFQQSLRFLDEEGVRVRYRNDVNGNKTRIPDLPEDGATTVRIVERSLD